MKLFNIGDRVVMVAPYDSHLAVSPGTVIRNIRGPLVEFDVPEEWMHDGEGGTEGSSNKWFCDDRVLELHFDKPMIDATPWWRSPLVADGDPDDGETPVPAG
jgi:hypothetical protein